MGERISAAERIIDTENYRDLFYGFAGGFLAQAMGALVGLALLRLLDGPVHWAQLPLATKAAVALCGPLAYAAVALARLRARRFLLAGLGVFFLVGYADLVVLVLRR
jgi:hypothetical protein